MRPDLDGLLLVDKPEGPTSHDIVARARRRTGQRRIGHTGTLDPMASGLLVLALGRATRLIRYLPAAPKLYIGSLRLGLTTSSDDITGTELTRFEGPFPTPERVCEAAAGFVGRIRQIPPRVSARKVGGERLYRLARRGVEVEAPAREVEVTRFALQPADAEQTYDFEAVVSSGTYIRALARDLGAGLSCGGVLTRLRRTAIGPMSIAAAADLEELELETALIPLAEIPLEPPAVHLDEPGTRRFLLGGEVPLAAAPPAGELFRALSPSGELLGVGISRSGLLQPKVVLPRRPPGP